MGIEQVEIPEYIHEIEINPDNTDYLICVSMLSSVLIITWVIGLTLYLTSKLI